jgi:hypothetical protein
VAHEEDLPNGQRSIIEITSVQEEDYGIYICFIENDYGTAHMAISFTRTSKFEKK